MMGVWSRGVILTVGKKSSLTCSVMDMGSPRMVASLGVTGRKLCCWKFAMGSHLLIGVHR